MCQAAELNDVETMQFIIDNVNNEGIELNFIDFVSQPQFNNFNQEVPLEVAAKAALKTGDSKAFDFLMNLGVQNPIFELTQKKYIEPLKQKISVLEAKLEKFDDDNSKNFIFKK